MESWLTSSGEDRESLSSADDMGCTEVSSICSNEIDHPLCSSSVKNFIGNLIGNTQLLCMQCRVIGPLLLARGKSHGFSRVAAGTLGIFSSYVGDAQSKWEFV